MDNAILFEDLVAYRDIETGLNKLIAATEKFGNTAVNQNERVAQTVADLKADLTSLIATMNGFGSKGGLEKIGGLKEDFKGLTTGIRANESALKRNEEVIRANSQVVEQMQSRLEELRKEYGNLDFARKEDLKRSKEIQREMSSTTRAISSLSSATQQAAKSVRAAEGSFSALKQQTADLKKQLDNLPNAYDKGTGAINKQNKAAVALNDQYQKNIEVVNKVQKGQQIFTQNVGNYGSAFQGAGKSLTSFAGQLFGISTAFEAVSAAIQITADMERLDAGLKAVSRDTDDFNRSQQFLVDTADDLGVRYDSLVKSYKLLKAATKDTSLEGAETEHIFHAVTEAGARLGLTAEDTEGALLALTQMLSKGKVTAEELRGQLGERVPAAMKIMAQATGLSEIELNKMMEKGQLMAVDVLPKFATELDKIYGGNAQEKITTMSAGWNRMTNNVQLFVASFNENEGVSTFFGKIENGIAQVFSDLTLLVKSNEWGLFMNYVNGGLATGNAVASGMRAAQSMAAQSEKKFRGLPSDDRQKVVNAADEKRLKIQKELDSLLDKSPTADVTAKEIVLQKELNKAKARYNFLVTTNNDQVTQEARIATAKTKEKVQADQLKAEQAAKDRKKAQTALDQATAEALGKSSAKSNDKLAGLSDQHQEGLIDEQAYIEQRLKMTLAGLNERQAILTKAGKKETDEYTKIQTEKKKADTEYRKSQLQIDLKANKGTREKSLAGLDAQRGEGDMSELDYLDRRHEIMVASIKQEQAILREAGQQQTELYKATDTALSDEQAEYLRKRLVATKKAWKDELQEAKEGLKSIDQQTGADYETELAKITQFYNKKRQAIRKDVASGKISQDKGDEQTYLVDLDELQAQKMALQLAYATDEINSGRLINAKIANLEKYKAASGRTEKEIAAADSQIADLKKAREQDLANDKIALDKKLADNSISQSNREDQNDEENAKKKKARRQQITDAAFELAKTIGDSYFDNQQKQTEKEMADLQKRQDAELASVGDNEGAKAMIQKKYDNERKALQRQEDRQQRDKAIFDIIISTAASVARVAYNPFLAVIVGALGAAQLAAVLTAPVPEYFAGKNIDGITNDNYTGPATIAEKGRELWFHDGKADLVEKKSLINVGRNDVITPNWLTERLLSDNKAMESNRIVTDLQAGRLANQQLVQGRANYDSSVLSRAFRNGPSAKSIGLEVAKAMADNPTWSLSIDKNGLNLHQKEMNTRRTTQANKHQLGKKG